MFCEAPLRLCVISMPMTTIHMEFDLGTTFANFLKHKKIIASVLKLLAALKLNVNSSKTQYMFVYESSRDNHYRWYQN